MSAQFVIPRKSGNTGKKHGFPITSGMTEQELHAMTAPLYPRILPSPEAFPSIHAFFLPRRTEMFSTPLPFRRNIIIIAAAYERYV
jgi:hypothetical protein